MVRKLGGWPLVETGVWEPCRHPSLTFSSTYIAQLRSKRLIKVPARKATCNTKLANVSRGFAHLLGLRSESVDSKGKWLQVLVLFQ